MILRIQTRLVLTYLVLIFFSTTVTYLFFLPRLGQYLEARTLEQLVSQSRILGNVIAGTYTGRSDANMMIVSEALPKQLKGVEGMRVRLYDPEGQLVYDSRDKVEGPPGLSEGAPTLDDRGKAALVGGQQTWVQDRVVHVVSPLRTVAQTFGLVEVSSELRDEETRSAILRIMAFALVISVLAAAALAWLLSKTIIGPIDRIRTAADRIANGDLAHRVATGPDELGRLGAAINHMAGELEQRIGEIVGQKNTMNSLLATLLDGVVALDREHRIHFMNRVSEQMLRATPEQAIGRPLLELTADVDLAPLLAECLEEKKLVSLETPFRDYILKFYFLPFEDEHNNHLGTMAVLHDVTDLRRLEEARAQFFGSVSHELRTPLTIIKGFASNQLDNELVAQDPSLRRSLEVIDRETDRLSRLVNDILELSRLRSKKMSMEMQVIDAEAAVRETLEQMEVHAARAGIALSWTLGTGPATLMADPDRFKQILINLVDNAIKYTPVGGKVHVSTAPDGDGWRVDIADTGTGIPAEELPFLFERFFRGSDTRRKGSSRGTGLGLAIVRELVEAHGGDIHVDSTVGKGSTVHLRFPLHATVA